MRNFVSLLVASVVFQLVIYSAVVLYIGSGRFDFLSILTGFGFWQMVIMTLLLHTYAYSLGEPWFMRLAGRVTMRFRLRCALAYAIFTLGVGCLFFLPFSLAYELSISIPVLGLATAGAFVGGYVRGITIDRWTGGGSAMMST